MPGQTGVACTAAAHVLWARRAAGLPKRPPLPCSTPTFLMEGRLTGLGTASLGPTVVEVLRCKGHAGLGPRGPTGGVCMAAHGREARPARTGPPGLSRAAHVRCKARMCTAHGAQRFWASACRSLMCCGGARPSHRSRAARRTFNTSRGPDRTPVKLAPAAAGCRSCCLGSVLQLLA